MVSWEIQGKLWGAEAENWVNFNESQNKPLWEAMIAAAKVGKDTRFLDAGCGSGRACAIAAESGAKVTGVDASEALINIARRRLPNGDFRVCNIEELPYQDNSFDVSFCAQTLNLVDSPDKAMNEMKRVTAPNGRIVIGLWGAPEKCDIARFGQSVKKEISSSIPNPVHQPSPVFALSSPGVLERLIEQNDLKILDCEEFDEQFECPDFETFWIGMKASGPFQGLMRLTSADKLKEAFHRAGDFLLDNKGAVKMKNSVKYVIATP